MKRGKDSGRISIKRFLLNKFLWIAFAETCFAQNMKDHERSTNKGQRYCISPMINKLY